MQSLPLDMGIVLININCTRRVQKVRRLTQLVTTAVKYIIFCHFQHNSLQPKCTSFSVSPKLGFCCRRTVDFALSSIAICHADNVLPSKLSLRVGRSGPVSTRWSKNGASLIFLARYMLSPVRLSVVCLSSVTLVRRPTQAVQVFGNISTALGDDAAGNR